MDHDFSNAIACEAISPASVGVLEAFWYAVPDVYPFAVEVRHVPGRFPFSLYHAAVFSLSSLLFIARNILTTGATVAHVHVDALFAVLDPDFDILDGCHLSAPVCGAVR